MTRQEMFDKAAQGILAQGCASWDMNHYRCTYRGHNNTKCAIGHLIPDDLYNDKIEGYPIIALEFYSNFENDNLAIQAQPLILKPAHISKNQIKFASDLQACHDNAEIDHFNFIEQFKLLMRDLAFKYKLNTAILDN